MKPLVSNPPIHFQYYAKGIKCYLLLNYGKKHKHDYFTSDQNLMFIYLFFFFMIVISHSSLHFMTFMLHNLNDLAVKFVLLIEVKVYGCKGKEENMVQWSCFYSHWKSKLELKFM